MPDFSKLNGYDVKDKTARTLINTKATGSFYDKLHGKTIIVLGDSLTIGSGQALALIWLENMQTGIKKVNEKYGLNISVEYRFKDLYEREGEDYGNNVNSGPVSVG